MHSFHAEAAKSCAKNKKIAATPFGVPCLAIINPLTTVCERGMSKASHTSSKPLPQTYTVLQKAGTK